MYLSSAVLMFSEVVAMSDLLGPSIARGLEITWGLSLISGGFRNSTQRLNILGTELVPKKYCFWNKKYTKKITLAEKLKSAILAKSAQWEKR